MSVPPSLQSIGDYELLEPIGQGGMGSVYRARQRMLDREVALKLLPAELARDRAFIERFYNEARATAKLNHPHIVAGIDVGEADGHYYFAMELVEGTSLKQMIEQFTALPEKQILEIGLAMAEALAHAHAAGIVHRDVKPDNILLDRDGVPKLADLGLARARTNNSSLTATGTALGTPHYIAPEQAEGRPDVDGRADAYALGCTLYHAATGNTPFSGENAAVVMVKHLSNKMRHPQAIRAKLSDGFCDVLTKLVARDPQDRYQNLAHAAQDLRALLNGETPRASSSPLPAAKINFEGGPHRRAASAGRRSSKGLPAASSLTTSKAVKKDRRGGTHRPPRTDRYPGARGGAGPVAWGLAALALLGGVAALAMFLARTDRKPEGAATAQTEGSSTDDAQAQRPTDTTAPAETPAKSPAATPTPVIIDDPEDEYPDEAATDADAGPAVALFDGKTFKGWHVTDPDWRIDHGWMFGKGRDRNAVLRLEAPLPQAFELSFELKTSHACHLGWEDTKSSVLNILHVRPDGLELCRYASRKSSNKHEAKLEARTTARRFRIRAIGSTVEVWVDDKPVVRSTRAHAPLVPPRLSIYARPNATTAFTGWSVRPLTAAARGKDASTVRRRQGAWTALYDGKGLAGLKVLDPEWKEHNGQLVGRYVNANARLKTGQVFDPGGACRLTAQWEGAFNVGFYGDKKDAALYLHVDRDGTVRLTMYDGKTHTPLGRTRCENDGQVHTFYVGFKQRQIGLWIDRVRKLVCDAGEAFRPQMRYGLFHIQSQSTLRISRLEQH